MKQTKYRNSKFKYKTEKSCLTLYIPFSEEILSHLHIFSIKLIAKSPKLLMLSKDRKAWKSFKYTVGVTLIIEEIF